MAGGLIPPGALRQNPVPGGVSPVNGSDAVIEIDGDDEGVHLDADGALVIEEDDGSVTIDFNPGANRKPRDDKFTANLADQIGDGELNRIAQDLLRDIQSDEQSRVEWLNTRAEGIRMLGLNIDNPKAPATDTSAPLEGMSNVRHPLLLEAVLRFQANARGELLPADGPVKVADKLTGKIKTGDELAEKLEQDLNYYLTVVCEEYYPDTDRMLFMVGAGGCEFKKVYNCPIRQRPVSESVGAKDIIVSDAATDMRGSGRVTHRIIMRPSMVRRMQLAGAYRDVPLSTPAGPQQTEVDRAIAHQQGVEPVAQQQEDRNHTIYECYCELNIMGFEDKERGEDTGLALPYRVVIEKDSSQVLEVRRNWRKDDPAKLPKIPFVKYPYVPGLGFYDIGLIHILGNTTNALTAAWRLLIDAGMFSNFPGFIYQKLFGHQNTNEFRVAPGGGVPFDGTGERIQDQIMPLPYREISAPFVAFIQSIAETGERVGGTADVQVAEGRQDAPVGTTLAMIDQATKIEGAVHKRCHNAQATEFQLLKECFQENPGAFLKAVQQRGETNWDEESFLAALDDSSIVPQADPNTPSHMHRLMKAVAVKQLQAASPGLYDARKVDERILRMIGVDNFDELFAPPQPGGGLPPEMQIKAAELADKPKQREHQVQMEAIKDQNAEKKHARDVQLQQMGDTNEMRQQIYELSKQDQESADEAADRQNRLQVAEIGSHESAMDNQTALKTEELKAKTARETGLLGVKAETLRAKTEDVKGRHATATAKAKPSPKPAKKK